MDPLPDEVVNALERSATPHLLELLRQAAQADPEDPEVLFSLGNLLTSSGQYEEGLKIDLDLSRICPEDPIVHYNLACSLSLLERTDEAMASIERAFGLGYGDVEFMMSDPDLGNLRRHPRFSELVDRWAGKRKGGEGGGGERSLPDGR
jgi:tetratricopeptide (TPR) repeat protein